ncbi:hypothetical protein OC845_004515 [Tilletia horrida]|nr:hypothetical protein OC845_004515 [Tilletia horrida]
MSGKVDFARTVGHIDADQDVAWRKKDVLLYAVGVGAGPDQLSYVYEGTPSFRAIPTYPLVLALKGADDEVNRFADRIKGRGALPGFPSLDPNTIVHGEQSLRIVRPLPTASGPGWKLRKRVSGVHDKGKALILEGENSLVSPDGQVYAVMVGSTFYRGGGQGTGFSKSEPSPEARPTDKPPKLDTSEGSKPSFEQQEPVLPAQAALYRLSGDIDPAIGQRGGLGGVILHGLCSYAFATRAILQAYDPKDGVPKQEAQVGLEYISGRFTAPVRLGDQLRTRVWKAGGPEDSAGWCAFEQVIIKPDGSTGAVSLKGVAKLTAGSAQGAAARL